MRLVVIGGGAAGFFCAVNAARLAPSLEVLIIERSSKLLSKVRVSGGGRCNVTHACFDISDMSRRYPRGSNFLKKSFHQFFTTDTIDWFKERGVEIRSEEDGRMFPVTNSSQTVIDCMLRDANRYSVQIRMNQEVSDVLKDRGKWILKMASGTEETCDFLVIATGGYPKSSMFEWIRKLGHSIEEPVPSLFTFNMPRHPITELMGVSVANASVKVTGTKLNEQGPLLITHWGLSGPAILRLSAWGARELASSKYSFGVVINWLTDYQEQSMREELVAMKSSSGKQLCHARNNFGLPQRLWQFLLSQSGVPSVMNWADMPGAIMNKLSKNLCSYELAISGKTTFKEEFVTAGGVKLSEIDVNTMQSKIQPNLFFCGEVMDVDGITGGYNFQHAWTSGFIAAKSIAGKIV